MKDCVFKSCKGAGSNAWLQASAKTGGLDQQIQWNCDKYPQDDATDQSSQVMQFMSQLKM